MTKQRVYIYESWTCNRRRLDASRLRDYFIANGYQLVTTPKDAQIIVLITCAYTTRHAEHALEMTKKFLNYKAELIVAGCLPKIESKELRNIFSGKMISTEEFNQFDTLFPENNIKFTTINDGNTPWENINEYFLLHTIKEIFGATSFFRRIQKKVGSPILEHIFEKESSNILRSTHSYLLMLYIRERWDPQLKLHKNSFFIRPAWGCLGNCSYCIIKKAIGPLKSKSLNSVISEFKNGLKQHYKFFIFDADDTGAYGIDTGANLPQLLNTVTDISGDYTIFIRNIHPIWIVRYQDQLKDILKKGKIRGIGSSIQSGNSRVLQLMQRYHEIEKIKKAYSELRASYPNLLLSTECIIGFPTETYKEFVETLQCIKEINFEVGYIYSFSNRPGTAAEKLEPKVPAFEISSRMKFAWNFLKTNGYHCSLLKNQGVLIFSHQSIDFKNNEDIRSFCLSTLN
jgi:tRNA A37 methylthiotransferase MiaB